MHSLLPSANSLTYVVTLAPPTVNLLVSKTCNVPALNFALASAIAASVPEAAQVPKSSETTLPSLNPPAQS